MVTLLHLADARLSGRLYVAGEALLKRARAAERTALRRAVDCALHEKVDAVLVAGGFFDERFLDYDTEQFLTQQLARLDDAGIACCYATGRPDPGGARFRGADVRWPASVHRFAAPAPEAVTLRSDEGEPIAHVVGAGYVGPETDAPRRAAFPRPRADVPHVGLLPAPLSEGTPEEDAPGAEEPSRRALRRTLTNAGYAYWALGGASRGPLVEGGKEQAAAWYAGPTAGRGPAHAGPQGGLLVRIGAAGDEAPHVSFRSFAPLRWTDLTLDALDDADTQHALLQRAQRAFREATAADETAADETAAGEEDAIARLARFTLTGGCPLASDLHTGDGRRRLKAALEDHLDLEAAFVRLRHLTLPADPERHRGEPHVLSEALDLLDRAAADPARLREWGPDVRAAGETDDDLRALLDGLDREACARLLRDA